MSKSTPFEPARFLTKINGADYLEVKWRLVWLRDRHPDAEVETVMVDHGGEHPTRQAVFKAVVRIPAGGLATGYGQETSGDFRDYLEKAETKAIGRALAALGFGTQFCPDHEFGQNRVVDSPVTVSRQRQTARQEEHGGAAIAAIGPDEGATLRQLRYLQAVSREAGMDDAALNERAMREFGVQAAALSRRDASTLIDLIQAGRQIPVTP